MKKFIKLFLTIYILYCIGHLAVNKPNPTYLDCGKILSKSNTETPMKHGTRTLLYLNVQFNSSGFKSMEVDPTTYYGNHEGGSICFNLYKETSAIYTINSLIGIVASLFISLTLVALFFIWLFDDNENSTIKGLFSENFLIL